MNSREKYLAVIAGITCLAGIILIYFSGSIILPVFIALILTYILNPLVVRLVKRGVNRTLAIATVFSALILLATIALFLFMTSLKAELSTVQINLPEYVARLYQVIPDQIKTYLNIETPDKAYQQLNAALQELRGVSFNLFRETFAVVSRAFTSTLAFVLTLLGYLITPVYLYYFLSDLPEMKAGLLGFVPERFRGTVMGKVKEVNEVLSAFVRGQLSVCAILAVLYSSGLYVIGIDLALLIGTLAGALFIIPYLGTIFGILHPLLCLGWFALVQAVEGGVITPKIVGNKVGLHPVITILALLIGGQLFGIFGMLLAVPVTAVLNVFFRSLLDYYRSTAYYKGV
jgi:predicted PurR-regulated permease PerM